MKKILLLLLALTGIKCTTVKMPNEINWASKVDHQTSLDACGTWVDFFQKKHRPKQSKGFCQKQLDKNAGQSDNYQLMSLEEFKNLSPLNASIYRWDHPGVTAESAYPPHARNRGQKDVASVRYHSQTLNKVSPIVVARVKAKGKVTYIKLDGVHRLVAAAIRGSMVKVLFVDL